MSVTGGDGVPFSDRDFAAIRDVITGYCGISLSDDYHARLRRVVMTRMSRCGMDTVTDYLRLLSPTMPESGELLRLVEEVANTETYFFREDFQLQALARDILPELIKLREPRRRLSLWSAGCSSGEEPYTLAMLLQMSPLWARGLDRWEIRVLGTDINRRMVRKARAGRYRPSSFKGLTEPRRRAIQARFFRVEGDLFSVDTELRGLVSFLHLNLLDRDGAGLFGEMDIILCRNVLMYFPLPVRMRVLRAFYQKLAVGGYLLLGHSENLLGLKTPFEVHRLKDALVYRKGGSVFGAHSDSRWER